MEKRFILFILICVVSFPIYNALFLPPPPERNPAGNESGSGAPNASPPGEGRVTTPATVTPSGTAQNAGSSGAGEANPANGANSEPSVEPARPQFESRAIELANENLHLTVSSRGATVTEAQLINYREVDSEETLRIFSPELLSGGAFTVELPSQGFDEMLANEDWELVTEVAGQSVTWRHRLGDGRSIEKTFTLPAEGYELEVAIQFFGDFPATRDVPYRILGPQRIRYEAASMRPNARVAGMRNGRGEVTETDHQRVGPVTGGARLDGRSIGWAGLESNYFACVLRPTALAQAPKTKMIEVGEPDKSRSSEFRGANEAGRQEWPVRVGFQTPLAVGQADRYQVFIGPKDPNLLSEFSAEGYSGLIDYGVLGILVRLFLFLLRTFEALIGSWGIAIVLLTVVVKGVLHPMNKRNQRSMQRQQKKMAKIQPEMKALREKHKSDPLKANQEIQKLFREHGVNPAQMAGGCLMLFLQLPIWIALISTFRIAIELRQAPFLYISDLTLPDRLASLPFSLPFLGDHFNLLPILYVIVTLIGQRMMPKSEDPQMRQQQKLMSFMMVAFGFIFYNFASGLLLYFLTSAALGILEQHIIRKELNREDEDAETVVGEGVVVKGPPPPPPPKPGQRVKRRS